MKAQWQERVCYPQFYRRIRNGMILHDAIYTPATLYRRTRHSKLFYASMEESRRRAKTLREENVPILELDEVLEKDYWVEFKNETPKQTKPTLLNRFISLFK